ncbi:hypothetical protein CAUPRSCDRAFT_11963, partial [Caulochytrium protostelioides]
IDSTPKIEAALQEQHQCPSPFHYRPSITEELEYHRYAIEQGLIEKPLCVGHALNGLAAIIEAYLLGETCHSTIYPITAYFNPVTAVIGFVSTTGLFLCFIIDGFFLAHIAERVVLNRDTIERNHRLVVAFAVIVALGMAIGFTATHTFQLGPSPLAPYAFNSWPPLATIVTAGVFILSGALCVAMVVFYLLRATFQSRFLYHSASKVTARAVSLLMLQWRTILLSTFVSLIWMFSLIAYVKSRSFAAVLSNNSLSSDYLTWVKCLFSTYDREQCQPFLSTATHNLSFVLIPGLLSGIYHVFMPLVLMLRVVVFDWIKGWPVVHQSRLSTTRSVNASSAQVPKLVSCGSTPGPATCIGKPIATHSVGNDFV